MELLAHDYAVTMPDLPGFGGMDSVYTIGKTATIDTLADYLAEFIQQYYPPNKKITVVGMSLGFAVITRMLQRHPSLTKRVDKLVSLFGFASGKDFTLPPKRLALYSVSSRLFSQPVLAKLYRSAFLNSYVLGRTYHKTPNAKEKFKGLDQQEILKNMAFEIKLWQDDDTQTYMKTGNEILTLDNTLVKIPLPVFHISVAHDRFLDNTRVEAGFRKIFTEYHLVAELTNANHAPTQIATKKQAEAFIPSAVLKSL